MSKLVYFMRPVGQIGPIKIGCSKLPTKRLEALSIVSPLRLELIAAVPGSHHDERTLHCMFKAHWLHHEWFNASKELLTLVDRVVAGGRLPELPKVVKFVLPRKQRTDGVRAVPRAAGKMIARGQRIRPAYEAGKSPRELAEQEGVSLSAIHQALTAVGTKMRPRGAPQKDTHGVADQVRADDFRRRYLAGETLQEIAEKHGVSRERVRQVLRKTGVPSLGWRRRGYWPRPRIAA